MGVGVECPLPAEPRPGGSEADPLDDLVPDPAGMPPMCDEAEFAEVLEAAVADDAPQLFAVVQVYGERVDYQIVA